PAKAAGNGTDAGAARDFRSNEACRRGRHRFVALAVGCENDLVIIFRRQHRSRAAAGTSASRSWAKSYDLSQKSSNEEFWRGRLTKAPKRASCRCAVTPEPSATGPEASNESQIRQPALDQAEAERH